MKFAHLFAASALLTVASAFAPVFQPAFVPVQARRSCSVAALATTTALRMVDSDFASAMPPKPEVSMKAQMDINAENFALNIRSSLGEGVEAPPELIALEEATKSGARVKILAIRIYELMIEQGMLYDQAPETGTLTPTDYDIPSNLDVPEVQKEFKYLYDYGMSLISSGLISIDDMKDIVKTRLIARTGLEPEKFDEWLGY